MLTLSKPRPKQPRHAASINRANPLGARILSAIVNGRNIVNGKSGVMSGTTAFRGTSQGLMSSLDGSSYLDLSAVGLYNDETKPVTICYYSKPIAAPTYAGVLRIAPIAAANEFVILRGASGSGYEFVVGSTAGGSAPNMVVPARTDNFAERVIVVALNGMQSGTPGAYVVWINRVKYTSSATVSYTAQPTNGTTYLGWDGPDSKWGGLLDELTIFSGAFSDADAANYFNDPWQGFSDVQPRFAAPASTGLTGVVSNASTAASTSTPTGSQIYTGLVSGAGTATAAGTPTGAQVYAGLVSGASTATALSTPAGTVGSVGAVAPASTATSASTPTGTQSYSGLVAGASTATLAGTPTGTQVYSGVVPAATTATALSTPTGTSGSLGAVAGASTATTAGTPTGSQIYAGLVSNAITATAAGTPTGAQVYAGLVASASTATNASTPTGTSGSLGVVAPASTAAFISTPTGTQSYAGAVAGGSTATLAGTPTGAQSYVGVVSYASTTTSLSTPTGTIGVAPSPPNRTTLIQDVQALLSALAPAGGVFYGANTRGAPVVYPYITWQRIISVPNVTLQGPSDLQSTRIQVDIISRQINEADAILKNMTAGFQTWPVGNVPLSSQDLYDDVVQAYRITADWSVWARN